MKRHLKSFLLFLKTKKIPSKEDLATLRDAPISFSKGLLIVGAIIVVSLFLHLLLLTANKITTEVPDYGGTIVEGVIGSPRFINPLVATSETDQMLTSLIYAPLVHIGDNGTLVPILASDCSVSPDQKTYQCTLRDHQTFSNKIPLTSADVLFTFLTKKAIELAKDPQSDWADISVEAPSSLVVIIKSVGLASALQEKLSLGIVPKSIWESIPLASIEDSILNMHPVGAGAFVLSHTTYTNTLPTEVVLKANKHFIQKPYLHSLVIHSYVNQLDLKSALHNGDLSDTSSLRSIYVDKQIQDAFNVIMTPTPKSVALFVNQNQKGSAIVQRLSAAGALIDRNKIIDTIENGYGIPLSPESSPSSNQKVVIAPLAAVPISIAVQKDDDLIATAQLLATALQDFGILSTVNVFDQGTYTDQLQLGTYSFVLASSSDTIPGYQRLIPLYTKVLVHISAKDIHTPTPGVIASAHESVRESASWYTRTDRVWNWFIHK